MIEIDRDKFLVDVLESRASLFIFGAGHVGKEVSALAVNVGFHSVVLDDRSDFANAERFPGPAEVIVLRSLNDCMSEVSINKDSYIVTATRAHAHDKTVLAQALRTEAGYIGMIGSKRKRDAVYKALLNEGFTERDLERVHCPIGIDIDTETPEEIAVSIVGELIDERAKARK